MPTKIQPPNYQYCPFCGNSLEIKIEEEQERKFCSDCKWTYYPRVSTAAGAIIIQDGQVLLVQRAREPYLGTWMLPAGFVDYGEHPADTVVREIREETGLKATDTEFYGLYQNYGSHWVIYQRLGGRAIGRCWVRLLLWPNNRFQDSLWKRQSQSNR